MRSLTEQLFITKVEMIKELQHLRYQDEDHVRHRNELIQSIIDHLDKLDEGNFRVRQQLKAVHKFRNRQTWESLNVQDVKEFKECIAPILPSLLDEEFAKRFDLAVYTIELAKLQQKTAKRTIQSMMETAESLASKGSIPQVREQQYIIKKAMTEPFWLEADLFDLEAVREALRDLVKFVEKKIQKVYYTHFQDEVLNVEKHSPFYHANDLQNYRKKVNQYLHEHRDQMAIHKLRNNKRLTKQDLQTLEHILWNELGTRQDYEKEFGSTPITRLVRQVVGLDPRAANEAFSSFLSNERLNAKQSRFVKLIIDYVVKNGWMEKKVLQEEPFKTVGSIVELFQDNMDDIHQIVAIIDEINKNAEEVVGA